MAKQISLTRYLVEQQRLDGHIPLRAALVARSRGTRLQKHQPRGEQRCAWAVSSVMSWARPAAKTCRAKCKRKLDIIANDVLIEANEWGGHLAAMASEEMDSIHVVPNRYPQGEYLLMFDPLDGSSNIDSQREHWHHLQRAQKSRKAPARASSEDDFLQPGTQQVAAGYCVYGSTNHLGADRG